MTPFALLEPLRAINGSHSPLAQKSEEVLWWVRLVSWSKESGPLPPGLKPVGVGEEIHGVGRLSTAELEEWTKQLTQGKNPQLGQSLNQSMAAHYAPAPVWQWGENNRWTVDFSRPQVMGIVNVTPDSFSGDGTQTVERAIAQGLEMAKQGADILDVGGESTRPGSRQVTPSEELERVIPVVSALSKQLSIPISIDSSKPEVMEQALEVGGAMINDVCALTLLEESQEGKRVLSLLAQSDCPIILMHMQGRPKTMQEAPRYHHVLSSVYGYLARRMDFCQANGIDKSRLMIDPGIGFGKTAEHNLDLMRHQRVLCGLGAPLLLGLSRKRIVGALSGEEQPQRRDSASHLLAALGYLSGAGVFRVHDVQGARQALRVATGWGKGLESTE
jgi:dihydropteroate synthase